MTRRSFAPSPFHDALLRRWRAYAVFAPASGLRHLARLYGMTEQQVCDVINWTQARKRSGPCPV